ncbi:MAG: arginine repressor [Bacteroidota bacterium]
MKNKTQRLLAIKDILTSHSISSQEELLQKLEEKGFRYTQATLSRDLKFLRISKVVDNKKGYIYKMPESSSEKNGGIMPDKQAATGFESIEFSNNLAVIKTLPGFASSVAFRIDSAGTYEILATVAGDDTILLIPREGISRTDVINSLSLIIPEVEIA